MRWDEVRGGMMASSPMRCGEMVTEDVITWFNL
jgi:hypothetical protein